MIALPCCFIFDDSGDPCPLDASWAVVWGDGPDDVVEGCDYHALMLVPIDEQEAKVYRI